MGGIDEILRSGRCPGVIVSRGRGPQPFPDSAKRPHVRIADDLRRTAEEYERDINASWERKRQYAAELQAQIAERFLE